MPAVAHRYFGAMHQSLSLQYAPCNCEACQEAQLSQQSDPPRPKAIDNLPAVAHRAFDQLHKKGSYRPEDLTKYKAYRDLITATSQVFSSAIPHEVPEEMRAYLERDVFVFSGLKTHTQLTEARSKLKDEQGNIRPYHLFEKEILRLNNTYNRNYLEAEYQFAIQSAQSAANWANLQEDTSRYWLEYRTAGDERVRQSHAALAGICLPKDDAFWTEYYPPNGWRCRCTAVEVLARENTKSNPETAKKAGEEATTQIGKSGNNKLAMFRFNPGQEKKVFPPTNTYTQVVGAEQVKKELETMVRKEDTSIYDNEVYSFLGKDEQSVISSWYYKNAIEMNDKIRPCEALCIHEYTDKIYRKINKYLRENKNEDENFDKYIKVTNSGLEKLPPFKGVVYRGTYLTQESIRLYKEAFEKGKTWIEKGFTSSSMDATAAFDGNVRYEILSKNGVMVEKLSEFANEKEVLFKSYTSFRILDIVEKNGNTYIRMEEI